MLAFGDGRRASWPLFALTLLPLIAAAHGAQAVAPVLPTGGKVIAGAAMIGAPSAGSLTINQASSKAIITWSGFSIGQGGTVQFDNGSGATLNRVTGTNLSSIAGLLSGTGSVYLINPNGVIIGKSGVVSVGGTFVASTLDTTNQNFLAGGDLTFSGSSPAAVINYGKVGSLGGDVALIAANVANTGSIAAANGTAGLVAGYSVLLRDASLDDGKFSVLVGGPGASVTNGGTIAAANAELRAEGGNVYALAGDTAGVVRATGIKSGDGHVWLVADGGTLDVAGTISAQGANGTAGAIETSGQTVNLGLARIDAHGGRWTLDPDDLTIDAAAASTIASSLNAGTSVTQSTSASGTGGSGDITLASGADIDWSTGASLTLSAYRNLTLNGTIEVAGPGVLNLIADNSSTGVGAIAINAPVSVINTSGRTAGAVTLSAPVTMLNNGNGVSVADLNLSFGSGASIDYGATANGGALSINGQAYRLLYKLSDSAAATGNGPDQGSDDIAGIDASGDGGFYALATNVSGSGSANTPQFSSPLAGGSGTSFTGALEGLGHSISGLTLADATTASVGLFGTVGGSGVVRDIGLVGGSVTGGPMSSADVGSLAGDVDAGALVANVSASALQTSEGLNVGGLIGVNAGEIISSSVGSAGGASVTGGGYYSAGAVGGLVGQNRVYGIILDDDATVPVTSGSPRTNIGGLVGWNGGVIAGSYATGSATGLAVDYGFGADGFYDGQAGGLVGYNTGEIYASNASGTVGTAFDAGGLVGDSSGYVYNSFATGSISGYGQVGGLVGSLDQGGVVATSYTSGVRVSGLGTDGPYVGGLVGGSGGSIVNSYATGAGGVGLVTSVTFASVGGLVGLNDGDVTGSQATIPVTSNDTGATGGFVGGNGGTIEDSFALGTTYAAGSGPAGGFAGENLTRGSISGSYASEIVVGYGAVGGFAGLNQQSGTISTSFTFAAQVQGGVSVGGFVGENDGVITGSNAEIGGQGNGAVMGDSFQYAAVGGLVGANTNDSLIENSYSTLPVMGGRASSSVGGLVGSNEGVVTTSYATGATTGAAESDGSVGGVVGYNTGLVEQSWAGGAVSSDGSFATGGFVGANSGTIQEAYAVGAVGDSAASPTNVGGFVGKNTLDGASPASISTTYASGAVSGSGATVGGFAGSNSTGGTISSSYYDTQTSGQATAVGDDPTSAGVAGLTTAQFMTPSSFFGDGWSFGVLGEAANWVIIDNDSSSNGAQGASGATRPMLLSEYSTVLTNAHQLQLVNLNLAANYTLANNIDASGTTNPSDVWIAATSTQGGFIPVGGSYPDVYAGVFDGAGHIVTGLNISNDVSTDGGSGQALAAGLFRQSTGTIENLGVVAGQVNGAGPTGALVGINSGVIENSYAETNVGYIPTGNTAYAGASGQYTSGEVLGGLVGYNGGAIDASFATGVVHGLSERVGGLVGTDYGLVTNSYATGSIVMDTTSFASTVYTIGGLIGELAFTNGGQNTVISNDYAAVSATGAVNYGGFVGTYDCQCSITNSYWDTTISGTQNGAALVGRTSGSYAITPIGGTGQPSPYAQSTYKGFDFTDTWAIQEGDSRPYLQAAPQSPPPQ